MRFSNIMQLFVLHNFLLTFAVEVNEESENSSAELGKDGDDVCICPLNYDPVCGSDGNTYGNACALGCKRKENPFVFGLCKGECPCCKEPFYNDPVANYEHVGFWGWDSTTGAPHQIPSISVEGEEPSKNKPNYCKDVFPVPNCFTTLEYAPVCGSDGNTYGNRGALGCQQRVKPCLELACEGPCPCCACPASGILTAPNA